MDYFSPDLIHELHAASREHVPKNEVGKMYEVKPNVPDPTIFSGLKLKRTNKDGEDTAIPSLAQCAVHLELLEAYKLLQEKVIKSNHLDVLFDTLPEKRYRTVSQYRGGRYVSRKILLKPIKDYDPAFQEGRKAKWMGFVNNAFLRFSTWATTISKSPNAFAKRLADDLIPPLDVLMIWHACLLKPRAYLDLCLRGGISWIRRLDFPWERIHAMIDPSDRRLHLPDENARVFERLTGLKPDLLMTLIEDPDDALAITGAPVSLEPAGSARFAAFWKGHDGWVDRMCHFLWIRSPALEFTLQNARERYRQYSNLLASDRSKDFALPPDVELVMLTHQLSPASYDTFLKAIMGRTIEYDIISRKGNEPEALRSTEEALHARSGTRPQRCFCWDCQNLQRLAKANSRNYGDENREPQQLVTAVIEEVANYRAIERAWRQHRVY